MYYDGLEEATLMKKRVLLAAVVIGMIGLSACGASNSTGSNDGEAINFEVRNESVSDSEVEQHYMINGKEVSKEEYDQENMVTAYMKKLTDNGYNLEYEKYEITGDKEVTFIYSDKKIIIDECNFTVEQ